MAEIIQIRRDTAANWTAANPILAQGEPALELDTLKEKIGDGITAWVDLAYRLSSGGGTDKSYLHDQPTPATTWNVPHNLGKYPTVTVIDSANTEVIGEVIHTDNNNLVINFNASFSGKAAIN